MRIIPKALYDRRLHDRMQKQDDARSARQKEEKALKDRENQKVANLLAKPLLKKLALQLNQAAENPTITWNYDEQTRDANLLVAEKIKKVLELRYYSVSFTEECTNEPQGHQEKYASLHYVITLKVS